jgi:hypothetical protein
MTQAQRDREFRKRMKHLKDEVELWMYRLDRWDEQTILEGGKNDIRVPMNVANALRTYVQLCVEDRAAFAARSPLALSNLNSTGGL